MNTADVIVIGGGIIGCATGYYLTKKGLKVYLFEKDYLTAGSTGRCIGGIRQQFSTELSITVAMESVKKFKSMKEELNQDVQFHQGGYLFCAHSEEKKAIYLKLIELQRKMGLAVEYIDVKAVKEIIPGINTDGLLGGAYCATDAQANPFLVVYGYVTRMKELGSRVFTNKEVVGIDIKGGKVVAIKTQDAKTYYAPIVVNAAGPYIRELSKLVNLDIPIFPERHEALITEPVKKFFEPMVVDYRPDGCYFIQRDETGQIIGCYTPLPNLPGLDLGTSFEFTKQLGRRMARLIPKLSNIKIIRQWSGSYEMTPDGNPILDITDIEGFWIVGGMCGHGFMLGPEIGWLAAEAITTGRIPYNIDEFSIKRDFSMTEVMK